MITIQPSSIYDPASLAPRLRPEDVREVETLGSTPMVALTKGLIGDKCLTVLDGRKPIAMFGVSTNPEDEQFGVIWLLASQELFTKARIRFIRESRHWLEYLSEGYIALYNIADSRNEAHLRWLKWLGFTFIRHIPVADTSYVEFIRPCAIQFQSHP